MGSSAGSEGSIGPFPQDYSQPHVYARDITSGAGNCVCAAALGGGVHTEAAPGVPVPVGARSFPALGDVRKGADEQRYVLALAYQAGPDPRITKGADGGRDYFTAEELEKACWSYLSSGSPQVGIGHVDGTMGAATVVESYIHRGPDWDLGDGMVVRKGDWLVGMILEPRSWDLAKAGKLAGVSPQGVARRRRRVSAA